MNRNLGPGSVFTPQLVDDNYNGGEPPGGNMEARIAKLETQAAVTDAKLAVMQAGLERIEGKLLTKWDMAQVVFFVVGALMAAAIFGPRIVGMIGSGSP